MTDQPNIIPNDLPDAALIERILQGKQRDFEVIMRRYNQRLYRIGMSVLDNDTEVEDALQSAYIKAYEHLAQFEHRSSFFTWLTRILLNQCYEQKRKAGMANNIVMPQSHNAVHMATPANILENKELSSVLELAIASLPEKYRLVFMLREIEDLSVKETSAILEIEEPNVKVRLNRAKTMLRENLDGYMKSHIYSFHLTRCDKIVNYVMKHIGL